jgi:hypothetical protein
MRNGCGGATAVEQKVISCCLMSFPCGHRVGKMATNKIISLKNCVVLVAVDDFGITSPPLDGT